MLLYTHLLEVFVSQPQHKYNIIHNCSFARSFKLPINACLKIDTDFIADIVLFLLAFQTRDTTHKTSITLILALNRRKADLHS